MKKKLNYDYCQAAPVLEWMSQKWALVVMLRIETCATSRRSHPSDLSEPMLLFKILNHTGSIFIHSLCSSVIKCLVFNNNQPRS